MLTDTKHKMFLRGQNFLEMNRIIETAIMPITLQLNGNE